MSAARPTYTGLPARIDYGASFTLSVVIPSTTATVNVMLMDLGFITHSVHMDQKAVGLVSTLSSDRRTLSIVGPPSAPGMYLKMSCEPYVLNETLSILSRTRLDICCLRRHSIYRPEDHYWYWRISTSG